MSKAVEQLLDEDEPGRVCCLWSLLSSSGVDLQQIRQLSIGLDQLLENVSCWRYRGTSQVYCQVVSQEEVEA